MKPELRSDVVKFRKALGKRLTEERLLMGIKSRYQVMRRSDYLTISQIGQIEEGSAAYTIDSLYKYLEATKIILKEVL